MGEKQTRYTKEEIAEIDADVEKFLVRYHPDYARNKTQHDSQTGHKFKDDSDLPEGVCEICHWVDPAAKCEDCGGSVLAHVIRIKAEEAMEEAMVVRGLALEIAAALASASESKHSSESSPDPSLNPFPSSFKNSSNDGRATND